MGAKTKPAAGPDYGAMTVPQLRAAVLARDASGRGVPGLRGALRRAKRADLVALLEGLDRDAARARAWRGPKIKRSELARLVFCNSSRLPRHVADGDRRMEYVGIGWIDVGPARPTDTLVVDD